MFPRAFFYQLEDEINRARQEINERHMAVEYEKPLSESIGHESRFLHYADRTIEVPLDAKIREPLQNPFEIEQNMSITGAANLAGTIKSRIDAAKQRIASVAANTDGALAKLNDAADTGDKIAKQIEAEADDLLAQIGQFSNGGPI